MSKLLHVTFLLVLSGRIVTSSFLLAPTFNDITLGLIVIDLGALTFSFSLSSVLVVPFSYTVTFNVFLIPVILSVMEIIARPSPTPSTTPALLTVATLVSLE